jgi:GT2 family glycosyltransferase
VVDNHSRDGTVKMVQTEFPGAKLIIMPDSFYGACETFNIGFANAVGEYIAILDDDVVLFCPYWTEKIIKKFECEPENTAIIATKIIDPLGLMWPSEKNSNKEFYCGNFIGAGVIIKTEALKKTRYYPKEYFIYWNEEELSAQILARGYKIKYFPEVETYHKGNRNQRMTKRRLYFEVRNRLWTFWMHESKREIIKKTAAHLYAYFLSSLRSKYVFSYIKGIIDAVMGLPGCIRNRETIDSPYWGIKN